MQTREHIVDMVYFFRSVGVETVMIKTYLKKVMVPVIWREFSPFGVPEQKVRGSELKE